MFAFSKAKMFMKWQSQFALELFVCCSKFHQIKKDNKIVTAKTWGVCLMKLRFPGLQEPVFFTSSLKLYLRSYKILNEVFIIFISSGNIEFLPCR